MFTTENPSGGVGWKNETPPKPTREREKVLPARAQSNCKWTEVVSWTRNRYVRRKKKFWKVVIFDSDAPEGAGHKLSKLKGPTTRPLMCLQATSVRAGKFLRTQSGYLKSGVAFSTKKCWKIAFSTKKSIFFTNPITCDAQKALLVVKATVWAIFWANKKNSMYFSFFAISIFEKIQKFTLHAKGG